MIDAGEPLGNEEAEFWMETHYPGSTGQTPPHFGFK